MVYGIGDEDRRMRLGIWIVIGTLDVGWGIRIGDLDWDFRLGIWDWDWKMKIGIVVSVLLRTQRNWSSVVFQGLSL